LSPFDDGNGHSQKSVYGNIPYNPVSVMNSSLANTLNESSISEMLISIQGIYDTSECICCIILSPFDDGNGHSQKSVYGNIPYNPVSVMNSSLADMLNESSISEMLISIQQVRLTLTDIESVDVDEMDRSALSELCTTSESVANIINELLAEDASLSASDSEDVCDNFVLSSPY